MASIWGSSIISKSVKSVFILILIGCVLVRSKVFKKCELGITLISNGIETSEVGKWICLANSVSNLNSTKITGTGSNNKEYGIFQISNYYYCWDKDKKKHNDCNINCTKLADDDVEDDIKCAKLVKRRLGFSKGWAPYKLQCENKSLAIYTEGCDFTHGRYPIIKNTETNLTLYLNSADEEIVCESEGTLPIKLGWFKFDKEVRPSQYPVGLFDDQSQNLTSLSIKFDKVKEDTEGKYTCEASSIYGQTRKNFFVRILDNNSNVISGEDFSGPPYVQDATTPAVVVAISVILTVVVTTLVFYVYYKRRHVLKGAGGLTKVQINAFYEGLPETRKVGKEPDESNESTFAKIYSKPYRKCEFEIPESDLDIDWKVVLGSGQFGIVYKGNYKHSVPVAVKTIQKQENSENTSKQLQALMDEVKIMSFIGSHPNIVSLIGAQTKNLKNDKLYVVLEYCPEGSLKSFLKKQRSKEITECPDESDEPSKDHVIVQTDDYMPSPEDEKIYIKDFVSYAHQIAYAMDFLAQKRIIHADLAARNILLLDRNIVKVTDFGLSKRMSDYEQYIRNNQEFVPWRWWAIESLRDFTFTSKSDVWSYGVTLWEIFSLAEVPHPEQTWNPEFSKQLKNGLRLLKPDLASDHIYQIMSQCWKEKPEDRPTFHQICDMMRKTLRKMSKFEVDYGESQESTPLVIGNGANIKL